MSKLVCFGDSITAGTWLAPDAAWPSHIDAGMPVVNAAVGGASLGWPSADFPPLVDWLVPTARRLDATHVVVAAGINDLIQTDQPNTLATSAMRIVDGLEGAGMICWWATVTPYRADAQWADILDGRRRRWNDFLRTHLPMRLLDWEGELRPLGAQYMPPELTYDFWHPNAAGHLLLGAFFDRTFVA